MPAAEPELLEPSGHAPTRLTRKDAAEAGGLLRPAVAHLPWLKPLSCYDRREDHEFACSRFG
jgi:hypothetical protein